MLKKTNCRIAYYVESKEGLQITTVGLREDEDRLEAINILLNYLKSEKLQLKKILSMYWFK